MGLVVLYLPADRLSERALWDKIRIWQKAAGLSWERLRLTPDFYQAGQIQRQEMQGMLDLLRLGQIDRVVYAELAAGQELNLDWLAFILSLQRYNIPVETISTGLLKLEQHLETLTDSFQQLNKPAKPRPRAIQKSL